ncbi:hypothetical protein ACFPZL_13870, partial [Leucobacter soli]|uniref:hypothetical protein n=1 Tax=Leucobacter soli TaxID=2812850 RepID=UPI003615E879
PAAGDDERGDLAERCDAGDCGGEVLGVLVLLVQPLAQQRRAIPRVRSDPRTASPGRVWG